MVELINGWENSWWGIVKLSNLNEWMKSIFDVLSFSQPRIAFAFVNRLLALTGLVHYDTNHLMASL